MSYNQLEIFQPPGEHESNIFEQAKKSKSIVQDLFRSLDLSIPNIKDVITQGYGVLKFNIKIDQIRDKDSVEEPSTPKMFIWHFTPSIILEIDGKEIVLLKEGDAYSPTILPKIIPKWINTLFTTNSLSKMEFHNFTEQYFTLEIMSDLLTDEINEEFVNRIEKHLGNKKLIIYFGCKFFPRSSEGYDSLLEHDVINKIKNYYSKLKNLRKDNWFFIGCYDDFTDESDFLIDLDNNKKVKESRRKIFKEKQDFYTLTDFFQNDYLFLNNAEFFSQKINTESWDTKYIVSPDILTDDFSDIDEKKIVKGQLNKEIEKRNIYCYIRKEGGARFFRNDILLPGKVENSNLKEIVAIAFGLKND